MEITPDTKIGDLLETWPRLEETLIELSPTFAKLRNPVLRRTVAKVATVRQAALVGGVALGKMINTLRAAAGLGAAGEETPDSGDMAFGRPEWVVDERVAASLDARPLLDGGENPMAQVLGALDRLKAGEVFLLVTPFTPAPLIDMAARRGFRSWSRRDGEDHFSTWFSR